MSCKIITNNKDEIVAIACGSSWGIGAYKTDMEGEFEWLYGFPPTSMNPHDFQPDEGCTEKELATWEQAKATWDVKGATQ